MVIADIGGAIEVNANAILGALQALAIVAGAFLFIYRGGRAAERMEAAIGATNKLASDQGEEIKELKKGFEKVADILTQLAVQHTRLNSMSERVALLDQRYEELRHGEGYVLPLKPVKG